MNFPFVKLKVIFVTFSLMLSVSAHAIEDISICNYCSYSKISNKAKTWGAQYLPPGATGIYNSYDLGNDKITTLKVIKSRSGGGVIQGGKGNTYSPTAGESVSVVNSSPDSYDINKFGDVTDAVSEVLDAMNNLIIPKSVVESSWNFLECSGCEGRVEAYIRDNSSVANGLAKIEQALKSSTIDTADFPDDVEVDLHDGGRIKIEVSAIVKGTNPGAADVVIKKVYDQANNTVPLDKEDLEEGDLYYLEDAGHNGVINYYITRYNFGIPKSSSPGWGKITICENGKCEEFPVDKP